MKNRLFPLFILISILSLLVGTTIGCGGGTNPPSNNPTPSPTRLNPTPTSAPTSTPAANQNVWVFISDLPGTVEQINVTITGVGFHILSGVQTTGWVNL